MLAKNSGIIAKPNNVTYQFGDKSWRGLKACLEAIRDDGQLQKDILSQVFEKDRETLV